MAVPALVLLVNDNYWLNMLMWLMGLVLAGYAAWPLSRHALAAVTPGPAGRPVRDDWWVRDGFVRTSVAFFLTVAVGTVFFVIPGIMVLMIYSLYPFLIIERRATGFVALAASSELTRGNRFRLLGLQFVSLTAFLPAAVCLYRWGPQPWSAVAFWALGAPALAGTFTTMAAAYRSLAGPAQGSTGRKTPTVR